MREVTFIDIPVQQINAESVDMLSDLLGRSAAENFGRRKLERVPRGRKHQIQNSIRASLTECDRYLALHWTKRV